MVNGVVMEVEPPKREKATTGPVGVTEERQKSSCQGSITRPSLETTSARAVQAPEDTLTPLVVPCSRSRRVATIVPNKIPGTVAQAPMATGSPQP